MRGRFSAWFWGMKTQRDGERSLFTDTKNLVRCLGSAAHELGLPTWGASRPNSLFASHPSFKDPGPPEPLPLNRFFLEDLALARRLFFEGKATQNRQRDLGGGRQQNSRDLLRDTTVLANAVSPGLTPLARWSGPS